MNLATDTDEEIARQVQNGDRESFGILVTRYEAKMERYARKFLSRSDDISDVVQEVFIKAYVNIQSFDSTRKFSSWLYRIAHNEYVNTLKKKSHSPLYLFDFDTLLPHLFSSDVTDRSSNERDMKNMLNQCLDKLDSKYREPLILYYFEEMNYQEIAEVLHIPISTVGVRLNRGKLMLQKICEQYV